MKEPKIEHVEGKMIIHRDGLRITVGNDYVSVDTDDKIELRGRSLKKLANVKASAINEVLHKLQE